MGIIDTILTGLMWIVAGTVILSMAAGVILGVYMNDKERIEKEREQEASKAESGHADPAAHRRRRRTAQGYPRPLS